MEMDYPLSGDAEATAASLLNASPQPKKIGAKTVNAIERADGAATAFSENGKVYSVRLRSPFSGDVRGIKIGYTKDAVIRVLGKPDRLWPVHDGIDRWFYDGKDVLESGF